MAEILYSLNIYDGAPVDARIVWLTEDDNEKFNEHLIFCGQKPAAHDWLREIYRQGTARYCLLYADGLPVARGAVEPYSERMWEAADIRVAREHRGRGYAKAILRFLSREIIANGKTATCRTEEDNLAMQKVIKSMGYQEMIP